MDDIFVKRISKLLVSINSDTHSLGGGEGWLLLIRILFGETAVLWLKWMPVSAVKDIGSGLWEGVVGLPEEGVIVF